MYTFWSVYRGVALVNVMLKFAVDAPAAMLRFVVLFTSVTVLPLFVHVTVFWQVTDPTLEGTSNLTRQAVTPVIPLFVTRILRL